uniref:hypothetical protein n=1 Tax=Komagataeibacter xylinus TaxID=28448 RepID=UPI000A5DBEC0|nr:hypothetical protein [Komagataeibacter xylinus]
MVRDPSRLAGAPPVAACRDWLAVARVWRAGQGGVDDLLKGAITALVAHVVL